MYDLTAFITGERRVEEHYRELSRNRGLRDAHALPRTSGPHPLRTWIGLRLIAVGGALAGASARVSTATPHGTNPEIRALV